MYDLKRRPLRKHPDCNAEKDSIEFGSSDNSPEKFIMSGHSPRSQKKNVSPLSEDGLPKSSNNVKRRSGKRQQNRFPNRADQNISPKNTYHNTSDVDMETDSFDDDSSFSDQEESEKIGIVRSEEIFSPKLDRLKNSTGDKMRRYDQPQIQSKNSKTLDSKSEYKNFFQCPKLGIILFIICILISLIVVYFFMFDSSASSTNNQLDATTNLVNTLRSEFGTQPNLTFRVIHSALRNVLGAEPESPAIILLLAANGSKTVCSDFAHKLIDSLSVPESTLKISGKDFKLANVNKGKLDIDKKIAKTLKNNQLGSVLIDDLDQIPGQTAIILHKYYDHEYAPFKKAVFVMTVNYNKTISDSSDTKMWDKAANDYLLSTWIDIGVDQVTALLSRLTVSVAVIFS